MPSSGRWMALFAGEFRRLRAASDFARGGKVTKTPPGTAPDEHFVLIVAFPRTPLRGTRTCHILQCFRRAKSGVLGCGSVRPHWGPGFWENGSWGGPAPAPGFPNQRARSVFRRRGAQCAPAGRSGTGPYERPESSPSFVGAAHRAALCRIRQNALGPGRKPRPCQDGSSPL